MGAVEQCHVLYSTHDLSDHEGIKENTEASGKINSRLDHNNRPPYRKLMVSFNSVGLKITLAITNQ